MHCSNCGSLLRKKDIYCTNCGEKIESGEMNNNDVIVGDKKYYRLLSRITILGRIFGVVSYPISIFLFMSFCLFYYRMPYILSPITVMTYSLFFINVFISLCGIVCSLFGFKIKGHRTKGIVGLVLSLGGLIVPLIVVLVMTYLYLMAAFLFIVLYFGL